MREFIVGCIAAAATFALMLAAAFALSGCATSGLYQMSDEYCESHPDAPASRCASTVLARATTYCQYGEHPGDAACSKAQSWDQANLKQHDRGCPTAIFVAPGGRLEQCR